MSTTQEQYDKLLLQRGEILSQREQLRERLIAIEGALVVLHGMLNPPKEE